MPPPAKAMTGRSIASASSTESPSGSQSAALKIVIGDQRARIGHVTDEMGVGVPTAHEGLEPSALLAISDNEEVDTSEGGGLDGQMHPLPARQTADDADAKRLAGAARTGRPVRRVDPVAYDRRASGDCGRRARHDRTHVLADGNDPLGARRGPSCERRAAGVEVMHHVVLGPKLRQTRPLRRPRADDMRRERVRVHDVNLLLVEEASQPPHIPRPQGAKQVRERVVAAGPAVVDGQPSRREVRGEGPVGRDEGDRMGCPGGVGPGRQVDEKSSSAPPMSPATTTCMTRNAPWAYSRERALSPRRRRRG